MKALRARDAAALLDFVAELRDLGEPLPFPPRLLAGLLRLIPSDGVGYSDDDLAARRKRVHVWHDADGEQGVILGDDGLWDRPSDRELYWRVRSTHPICAYRDATGDWTTPHKVSDFATVREYRRTPFYEAFVRGGFCHVLNVPLGATPMRQRYFGFVGERRDFDERDRLVMRLVQPHLAARAQAVATAAAAVDALAAVEAGSDDASLVVLCSRHGVIEYASPASRALLARYLGLENGSLPTGLLTRSELHVQRNGSGLDVRVARTGGLHVLLLGERDLRVEELTAREREILGGVARGLQNDAIALELGIATATVAKHLEHIYRKLGVTNRTSAAAALGKRPD